jgi:hypothetical protein
MERGDEGRYGPAWDGVHLVMGVITSICIFVKYFKG